VCGKKKFNGSLGPPKGKNPQAPTNLFAVYIQKQGGDEKAADTESEEGGKKEVGPTSDKESPYPFKNPKGVVVPKGKDKEKEKKSKKKAPMVTWGVSNFQKFSPSDPKK